MGIGRIDLHIGVYYATNYCTASVRECQRFAGWAQVAQDPYIWELTNFEPDRIAGGDSYIEWHAHIDVDVVLIWHDV